MHAKTFYDTTAEKYDERHDNVRTKYMRSIEQKLIKKFAAGKVLDIGCGTGRHLKYGGIGLDISAGMLRHAKKKGFDNLVQAKAEDLPFRDNCFDSVLCMFTVLNLCDYGKAVSEIRRVLRKNGIAMVSAASIWDNAKEDFFTRILSGRKSHMLHMRIEKFRFNFFAFNKKDFINLFQGFDLKHFHGAYMLAKPYWGWHRDFSAVAKIKLRIAFALERVLQPFNKTSRMYFAVFEKL